MSIESIFTRWRNPEETLWEERIHWDCLTSGRWSACSGGICMFRWLDMNHIVMMRRITWCELCELHTIDKLYFECDDYIILDCSSCKVPMVVTKDHIDPRNKNADHHTWHTILRDRMELSLTRVAETFYKDIPFYIDKQERKIPGHMHWHARPKSRRFTGVL